MRLLDPRNGPDGDLPPDPGHRVYVIASTPRTGSTLLARLLEATGRAGVPKEYLNPMQVRDWTVRRGGLAGLAHRPLWGPLAGATLLLPRGAAWLDAHLADVRSRRACGGWFGLKLHAHHHARWFAHRDVASALGPVTWIRVRREDRLGQAISWARALQTGAWASHQRPLRPPRYRRTAVLARLDAIDAGEGHWDRVLGPAAFTVRYEALIEQPAATLSAVLEALDAPGPVAVPDVGLHRQADAVSDAWRARFLAGR